jgi:hypothetical protein
VSAEHLIRVDVPDVLAGGADADGTEAIIAGVSSRGPLPEPKALAT